MSTNDSTSNQALKDQIEQLKTALAVQEATMAGAQATQAATHAGQAATSAAALPAHGQPSSSVGWL